MIFILIYFIIGVIITALLYETDPEDTVRDILTDGIISIVGWPLVIALVLIDSFHEK